MKHQTKCGGLLDDAREMFMKAANLGDNPILDARDPDLPVGLKVCLHFCQSSNNRSLSSFP